MFDYGFDRIVQNFMATVLDAKVDKLSWLMGILIALVVANFAKQLF